MFEYQSLMAELVDMDVVNVLRLTGHKLQLLRFGWPVELQEEAKCLCRKQCHLIV